MNEVLTILFLAFAAACNAIMDRLEYPEAFNVSIFRKDDKSFWLKTESWRRKYVNGNNGAHKKIYLFGKRTPFDIDPISDGWHIAKMMMVVFIALAIVSSLMGRLIWVFDMGWVNVLLNMGAVGLIWNLSFSLCYNKLFKMKVMKYTLTLEQVWAIEELLAENPTALTEFQRAVGDHPIKPPKT